MKLCQLIPDVAEEYDQEISGFAIDNRKVAKGTIFGAFQGGKFNGEDFIQDAITSGAIAVVARPGARVVGAVHLAEDNPRRAFANLAGRYYQPFPATIAAVTGTNGKTSVAELTRQLWRIAGHNAASIGTLGITTSSDQTSTGLTTPDIVTFLSNMSGLAREGVTHSIFESSSHGLSQYRSEGVKVRVAAFTNLSRDHLDYHGNMEDYFTAKMRLFAEVVDDNGVAVVWADDNWSQRAIDVIKERGLRLFTVGTSGHDICILDRVPSQLGQNLTIEIQQQQLKISLPLIGEYQAANALTAAAIVIASGESVDKVIGHLHMLQPVSGRLERAAITRRGAPIYVDYAHTPDGLVAAIAALRPHCNGKLITVFGAGGDRDKGKRPEMGAVVASDSDVAIVTDDNPRSEDPATIRSEILTAARGALEIGDRREAIAKAVSLAGSEDIILIAGKGHEQGQVVGDRVLPFDDVQVARECAA